MQGDNLTQPEVPGIIGTFIPQPLVVGHLSLLPAFNGCNDVLTVGEFFEKVEEVASHFSWSEADRYFAAKNKLQGEAASYCREQKYVIKDYESLKKSLLERYNAPTNFNSATQEFLTFTQPPDMPVAVFFAKANALSFRAFCRGESPPEVEETLRVQMLKTMLLENLTPEVKRHVIAANPSTIDEIRDEALLQEKAWVSCRRRGNPFVEENNQSLFAIQGATARYTKESELANICDKLAKKVEELNLKVEKLTELNREKADRTARRQRGSCFFCGKVGHYSNTCWHRAQYNPNEQEGQRQERQYRPRYERNMQRQETQYRQRYDRDMHTGNDTIPKVPLTDQRVFLQSHENQNFIHQDIHSNLNQCRANN